MGDFALIGLGSNLGDREATLDRALVALDAATGVGVRDVSAYHATAPVGGPGGQGAFLNAAARLETNLEPAALHRLLREIEHRAGRTRDVRWGARTLDLDLILFGDRVIDAPELSVPHPRMGVRRFVLAPMAEVAPDAVDPMTGRTIRELLLNLDRRPSYVAFDDPQRSNRTVEVARRVAEALGAGLLERPSSDDPDSKASVLDQVSSASRQLREEADRIRRRGGPGWIVSNYCLPMDRFRDSYWFDLEARSPDDPDRAEDPFGHLAEAIQRCRQFDDRPTFCVASPWSFWGREDQIAGAVDFPLLLTESLSPDRAVTEVLAGCAASRP